MTPSGLRNAASSVNTNTPPIVAAYECRGAPGGVDMAGLWGHGRGDATQGYCRSQGWQLKIENIVKLLRLCHALPLVGSAGKVPVPASKNAHDLAAIVMLDDASEAVPAEADVYGYGNKKAERLDEQIAKLIICG